MTFKFIFQALLIVSFACIVYYREKTNFFSVIYLSTIPLLSFFQGELSVLFLGLLLGYGLFICLYRPSLKKILLFASFLLLIFFLYSPQLTIPKIEESLHIINQQRGEHLTPFLSWLPRFFHNKFQLAYFVLQRAQSHFSINALFIQGNYAIFSPLYFLGYLFPWDLIILYYLFSKNGGSKESQVLNLRWLIVLAIYLLLGLVSNSNEFANIFTMALVYWLAIYASSVFKFVRKKTKILIISSNFAFLLLHLFLSSSFIQIL